MQQKIENIVIINDFNYIQGGASKVAIQTANILSKNGYNVYFFSASREENNVLDKAVINIFTNQGECLQEGIKGVANGIYNIKAKKELTKLLNNLDTENTIIHIHGWTKALSSSVFDVAHKLNFKVVLTMHDYFTCCPNGGLFNYKENKICYKKPCSIKCNLCNCDSRNYLFKIYRIIRQYIYNRSIKKLKNVIAISDFSLKILNPYLKNKNIFRLNNPIDFERKEKNNYYLNNYYLYVGRISKEKGVEIFCEAITKLKYKGIIVGDGDLKEQLEKKYKNITFVGWKNSKEVKEFMKNAKCLVMPSRWYECAPLTNLEALSMGVPSLVSENCAASDISNKGNNTGDKFKLEVDELVKCIQKFEKQKINLNQDILDSYSEKKYLTNLEKIYKKII